MKHLDEGTLQAWLDMPRSGLDASEVAEIEAHLAQCDECSTTLDALRGSDTSVHALLAGGLDRDIERPPFEEVVARAEGRPPETGGVGGGGGAARGLSRLNRLAWAASIVVALGVGWMTNEIYRAGPPNPSSRVPVAPASERARITAEAPSEAAVEADRSGSDDLAESAVEERAATASELTAPVDVAEAEPAPQAAEQRTAPSASAVRDEDVPASQADEVSGAGRGAVPAGPGPDSLAVRRYERQRAPADDASRDDFAASAAPAPPPSPTPAPAEDRLVAYQDSVRSARPVVSGVVRDADTGEPVSSAQVFIENLNIGALTDADGSYRLILPPGDSMGVEVTVMRIGYRQEERDVVVSPGAPNVADFTLQEEALRLDEVVVTGTPGRVQRRALGNSVQRLSAASVAYAWRPSTPEDAAEALGRSLFTVPDAEILSVETVEPDEPGGDVLVRIRQTLGRDGTVLTLVEGVSDESRDGWSIPSDGSLASARRGDVLITGTFALSEGYLRTLLESLRPTP